MAYDGYLAFAGQELVNRARLNAYMSYQMPGILRDCDCDCDSLAEALGHQGYSTPFGDLAPWVDPDDPDSAEYAGMMINSIKGLDDAVREVSYVEGPRPGGSVTGVRGTVREARVVATMFASSDRGMEAGWRWLKSVLSGSCSSDCAPVDELCFFSACPPVGRPLGAQRALTIHPNNLIPGLGSWDGRTFTPFEGTMLLEEVPTGYSPTDLPEDPEGYSPAPETNTVSGYSSIPVATLSTPRLDRPISCGTASWNLTLSGEGEVWLQVVVDGEVVSSQALTLTEERQTLVATEGGLAGTNSSVHARIAAGEGTVVQVHEVRLFAHEEPEPTDDCSDDYLRLLRRVIVIDGPRTRGEGVTRDGAVIREIEFTVGAMTPDIFGSPVDVATMYHGQTTGRHGAVIRRWFGPVAECVPNDPEPLLDPDCLPLAPLPEVPTIPVGCGGIQPWEWQAAYLVEIPGNLLREWTDMVPVITLRSEEEVRGVRVRFFPRPTEDWKMEDIDSCSACGSFEVSYIPPSAVMTIDGMSQRVLVEDRDGRVRPASHLVSSGVNDRALSWPELACGIGYFMLVEVVSPELAGISVSLASRE